MPAPARNYRLQGANILKMIKQDVLKTSPNVSVDERDILNTTADASREEAASRVPGRLNWKTDDEDEDGDEEEDLGPQSPTKSSRTDRSLAQEKSLQDLRAKHLPPQRAAAPPSTIMFSAQVPPSLSAPQRPSTLHPQTDMNRFVSSSTSSALSGTTAGSFVKHPGPPGAMRTIKPEEVQGVLPNAYGGMVYEPQTHKWVRQRGTDESDDPFGDIESLADTTRGSQIQAPTKAEEVDGSNIEQEDLQVEERSDDASQVEVQTGDASQEEDQLSEDLFAEENDHIQSPPPIEVGPVQYDSDSTATVSVQPTAPPQVTQQDDPPTPKARTRTLEELSESLANMSMQMDLSPPRPIRPFTVTAQTPKPSLIPPPRSVLKSIPFFVNGPVAKEKEKVQETPRNVRDRRSVSFSDGRKSGKIRELAGSQAEETTEEVSTLGTTSGRASENAGSGFVPSVRTQRIHALFDNLDDSGENVNHLAYWLGADVLSCSRGRFGHLRL